MVSIRDSLAKWTTRPICLHHIVFIPTLARRKIMVFLFAYLYLFVTCLHVFHLSFNYTYQMEFILYIAYDTIWVHLYPICRYISQSKVYRLIKRINFVCSNIALAPIYILVKKVYVHKDISVYTYTPELLL